MRKKTLPAQKIIVPKGTIDASNDTIIEVPKSLQREPVVVAKKICENDSTPNEQFDIVELPKIKQPAPCGLGSSLEYIAQVFGVTGASGTSGAAAPVTSSGICNNLGTSGGTFGGFSNLPAGTGYGGTTGEYGPGSTCATIAPSYRSATRGARSAGNYEPSTKIGGLTDVSLMVRQQIPVEDTEAAERTYILRQLDEYHRARRRFLSDASAVASKSSFNKVNMDEVRHRDFRESVGVQTSSALPRYGTGRDPESSARDPLNRPLVRQEIPADRRNAVRTHTSTDLNMGFREEELLEMNLMRRLREDDLLSDAGSDISDYVPDQNFPTKIKSSDMVRRSTSPRVDFDYSADKQKAVRRRAMEQKQSKSSQSSKVVASTESCPATDCLYASKRSDDSCGPCCKPPRSRSQSYMTEPEFEEIKEQLRRARLKLDEAVSMVSRTLATSSRNAMGGRLPPEPDADRPYQGTSRDTTPTISRDAPRYKVECPKANRSKSTTDGMLSQEPPGIMRAPAAWEYPKKKQEDPVQSSPRSALKSDPSSITCTLMYPCEIPSGASLESLTCVPSKNVPVQKVEELYQKPVTADVRMRDSRTPPQTNRSEVNPLCSSVCLNMDPAPCTTLEEMMNRKAAELEQTMRRLLASANANTVPSVRQIPREIPAASAPPPCSLDDDSVDYQRFEESLVRREEAARAPSRFDDCQPLCAPEDAGTQPRRREDATSRRPDQNMQVRVATQTLEADRPSGSKASLPIVGIGVPFHFNPYRVPNTQHSKHSLELRWKAAQVAAAKADILTRESNGGQEYILSCKETRKTSTSPRLSNIDCVPVHPCELSSLFRSGQGAPEHLQNGRNIVQDPRQRGREEPICTYEDTPYGTIYKIQCVNPQGRGAQPTVNYHNRAFLMNMNSTMHYHTESATELDEQRTEYERLLRREDEINAKNDQPQSSLRPQSESNASEDVTLVPEKSSKRGKFFRSRKKSNMDETVSKGDDVRGKTTVATQTERNVTLTEEKADLQSPGSSGSKSKN